jgi:hypothetical protein
VSLNTFLTLTSPSKQRIKNVEKEKYSLFYFLKSGEWRQKEIVSWHLQQRKFWKIPSKNISLWGTVPARVA